MSKKNRRNPQITIHSIILFLHCEYYSLSVAHAICDLRTLVCCLALHNCTPLLGPLHWGAYGRKDTRGCSVQAYQRLRPPGPTKSFCMELKTERCSFSALPLRACRYNPGKL